MPMTITILGCGGSGGVPLIGCKCAICCSTDIRNKRTRVSVLVQDGTTTLLIDCSPDFRQQALMHGISRLDAVIATHGHADHIHGIDDLRAVNYHMAGPIALYAQDDTLAALRTRFGYCFAEAAPEKSIWVKPMLQANVVTTQDTVTIGTLTVQCFPQVHGKAEILGLRIGDFAYSTDVKYLPEEAFAVLAGVKLWVVDCLREEMAPTHSHLAQTLEWIERVRPQRSILTHMDHTLDYSTLAAKVPVGVEPAYDGLVLKCP
jgi:phosphoribosyl 1,2-cyclic phosphate phosphodiesterase